MPRRRRRIATEFVRPDFPVFPMYVVSVLFLAFFVFTFRPAATEGNISVALPVEVGGEDFFNPADAPATLVVAVASRPNGTIGNMTVRTTGGAPGGQVIGASIGRYRVELRKRKAAFAGKPIKLILEIGDGLLYESYVRLLDVAIQAGFEDVSAVPMDAKKR